MKITKELDVFKQEFDNKFQSDIVNVRIRHFKPVITSSSTQQRCVYFALQTSQSKIHFRNFFQNLLQGLDHSYYHKTPHIRRILYKKKGEILF